MAYPDQQITIDCRTGAIAGARAHELVAVWLVRLASIILKPVNHFGLSYICRAVRTLLPSDRPFLFLIDADTRFRVDYCDAYWSVLTVANYVYEPPIRRFVDEMRDVDYAFLDCGANQGYWSAIVSSPAGGKHRVIAVEAASDTYWHLADNQALNRGAFTGINRAISGRSGEIVKIYGVKHEARSMLPSGAGDTSALEVETLSLDDLADHPAVAGAPMVAIKLDVEGVEIDAMSAAERLLARETVFLYEDHGHDRTHKVTEFAMGALGMRVFWLGRGGPYEITSLNQLDAIKVSRRRGYDFAASRSPIWLAKLDGVVARAAQSH